MQNGVSEGCFDVLEMMKMDAYIGAYSKNDFSCDASSLWEMNSFDWHCYEHGSQAILWLLFYDEVYGRYVGRYQADVYGFDNRSFGMKIMKSYVFDRGKWDMLEIMSIGLSTLKEGALDIPCLWLLIDI